LTAILGGDFYEIQLSTWLPIYVCQILAKTYRKTQDAHFTASIFGIGDYSLRELIQSCSPFISNYTDQDPRKALGKKWIHAATGATFHGKRKPRRSGANFLAFYRSIPTKRRLSFDGVM
jgi:hypothetical protein